MTGPEPLKLRVPRCKSCHSFQALATQFRVQATYTNDVNLFDLEFFELRHLCKLQNLRVA